MFEKSFRRDFSPKDGAQDMGNFSVGQEPDPPKVDKLEGTSPDAPKILGSAGALPSKKTSPFATRHSPPFLARQEPRPPISSTDSKSVST